jgi:beta-1,4-N-acetylglucosaminyltransferase
VRRTPPSSSKTFANVNKHLFADFVLPVERYRFKPSLSSDIAACSLIISHAGAGTCLEVQRERKPHIVVVNEQLMDNHQVELAEKLAEGGHLVHCVCSTLLETIVTFDDSKLVPFPEGDLASFKGYVDVLVKDLL